MTSFVDESCSIHQQSLITITLNRFQNHTRQLRFVSRLCAGCILLGSTSLDIVGFMLSLSVIVE